MVDLRRRSLSSGSVDGGAVKFFKVNFARQCMMKFWCILFQLVALRGGLGLRLALTAGIYIQTATGATKFSKQFFSKPSGAENFSK